MTDAERAEDGPGDLGDYVGWARDFALLAGGTGLLAPTMLGVMITALDDAPGALGVLSAVGFTCLVVGLVVGPVVGVLFRAGAGWLQDRPLWLFPVGFPVGGVFGGVPGYVIARLAEPYSWQAWVAAGAISATAGGLVLGFAWVPYLALRLQGRSGWPVMLLMALMAPGIGIVSVFGFALTMEWADLL